MSVIVGIDPGNSGAIAVVVGGRLEAVDDMPVVDKLISEVLFAQLCWHYEASHGRIDMCVIERVGAMPKQGVSTTFKFGTAYGIQRAVPAALGWPITHVTPTQWKRDLNLGRDKDQSRRLAIERWPHMADAFRRKKDDGRAEAALIAWWHTRHNTAPTDADGITNQKATPE